MPEDVVLFDQQVRHRMTGRYVRQNVNKRPGLTPRTFGRSTAWAADRRRDPITPINNRGIGCLRHGALLANGAEARPDHPMNGRRHLANISENSNFFASRALLGAPPHRRAVPDEHAKAPQRESRQHPYP
jgi:hypothetical protein